jgi:hypothetical protein
MRRIPGLQGRDETSDENCFVFRKRLLSLTLKLAR